MRVYDLVVEDDHSFIADGVVAHNSNWGPLGQRGRPLKKRRGETFNAWVAAVRSLGYNVEHRVLNAADYGDATSRRRLFVIAKRGNGEIHWPQPTFSKDGSVPGTQPWRAARDVIDWSLKGKSIFSRKRPLAKATMRRIIAGLERFGGPELKPFLVILRGTGTARSVEQPLPAVTAGGNHLALVEPAGAETDEEKAGAFILPPLGFYARGGKANRPRSPKEPLQTITRRGGGHLVQPFIVNFHGNHRGRSDGDERVKSVGEPLPTLDTSNRLGVVEPYLIQYYSHGSGLTARSVDEPMPTLLSKDHLALIQPVVNGKVLDILFRMLQPHELARAMGFGDGYKFAGNKTEVVKQIGNAVAVHMSQALCYSLLMDSPQPVPDPLADGLAPEGGAEAAEAEA